MGSERTRDDRLVDDLLVLAIVHTANEQRAPQDIMNVMKAVFAAAWDLAQRSVRAITLRFVAFKHGPFSKEVYDVLNRLVEAGLLARGRGLGWSGPYYTYELTDKGREVLQSCMPLLQAPHNEAVFRAIVAAAREVGARPSWHNRQVYHNMEIPDPRDPSATVAIGELRPGTAILSPPGAATAGTRFHLDDDWYETLDIMLSPEYDPAAMRKASDVTHEELFADV